jgi:hypothetical protein
MQRARSLPLRPPPGGAANQRPPNAPKPAEKGGGLTGEGTGAPSDGQGWLDMVRLRAAPRRDTVTIGLLG